DDALRVRGDEGARGRERERDGLVDRHRTFGDAVGEVVAVEPLHREVEVAGAERAVRHERDDAGIAQVGEQPDLALEARTRGAAELAHHLQRDGRSRLEIACTIHVSHSAASMERDDLEATVDLVPDADGLHHARGRRIPYTPLPVATVSAGALEW